MSEEKNLDINFKISGTELNAETGYDLYYLSESMRLFHQLIEKTYLSIKDEKHMSREKREDLEIKVFNIRDGSFEADFQLIINHVVPSLIPMVTAVNANSVWEMTKLSFKYLLIILQANKSGERVSLKEVNAENIQVVNGSGNIFINVHPDVIQTARATYPVYKRMSNMIDESDKTMEKLTFSEMSNIKENIEIGVKEKMLLQNEKTLEKEPIKFRGKIYDADSITKTGKLEVLESADIKEGDYKFEFIDKESIVMKDYFTVEGDFIALKLTTFNPNTLEKAINKLSIVNVKLN